MQWCVTLLFSCSSGYQRPAAVPGRSPRASLPNLPGQLSDLTFPWSCAADISSQNRYASCPLCQAQLAVPEFTWEPSFPARGRDWSRKINLHFFLVGFAVKIWMKRFSSPRALGGKKFFCYWQFWFVGSWQKKLLWSCFLNLRSSLPFSRLLLQRFCHCLGTVGGYVFNLRSKKAISSLRSKAVGAFLKFSTSLYESSSLRWGQFGAGLLRCSGVPCQFSMCYCWHLCWNDRSWLTRAVGVCPAAVRQTAVKKKRWYKKQRANQPFSRTGYVDDQVDISSDVIKSCELNDLSFTVLFRAAQCIPGLSRMQSCWF